MAHGMLVGAVVLLSMPSNAAADGRIIAIGDEWTFSDPGFAQEPAAASIFALNCAELLVGPSGSILAYSNNVALTGASLPALLTANGYTFTRTTAPPFTLDTLMQYDSVWLAGVSGSGGANAQVLVDYVHAGGNVLVSAATGEFGSASGEAAAWSPFLSEFGLAFGDTWFPVKFLVSVPLNPSLNPAAQGVTEVVWGYGQTAFEIAPSDLLTDAISADFAQWGIGTQFVAATYLPACSSECPADLDGSRDVSGADLTVLLGAWGQPGGNADVNCDGIVDGGDIAALLGSWGACPG